MFRIYRILVFTVPATMLALWLAAGKYNEIQKRDHYRAALQVARMLAIGAVTYAEEHHEQYPPANRWEQALRPYIGDMALTVPRSVGGHGRRFAMNRAIAGRKLSAIEQPASVILFYESTSNRPDTADDLETMVPKDDSNQLVLAYADGHIEDYYPALARDIGIQRSRDAMKSTGSHVRSR